MSDPNVKTKKIKSNKVSSNYEDFKKVKPKNSESEKYGLTKDAREHLDKIFYY